MFISKGVDRIIEPKTCFLWRYGLILLILRNNARFFLFFIYKFHYSFYGIHRAILGFMGLASPIVTSGLRESENFSLGCFVGPEYFIMGISWVQFFFSWIFRESKIFPPGYFVGPRFYNFQ